MNKLFLIMGEISYCFNYLESDCFEALPDTPRPPTSPLGLVEQFPVLKNTFAENGFFKNKTPSQENEIPAPLLHDKCPPRPTRARPGPHGPVCANSGGGGRGAGAGPLITVVGSNGRSNF